MGLDVWSVFEGIRQVREFLPLSLMLPDINRAGLPRGVFSEADYPGVEGFIGGDRMFIYLLRVSGIPQRSTNFTLVGGKESRSGTRSMSPTLFVANSSGVYAFTTGGTTSLEKWKNFQLIVR